VLHHHCRGHCLFGTAVWLTFETSKANSCSFLLLTTITGSNSQACRGFSFFKGTGTSAKHQAPKDSGPDDLPQPQPHHPLHLPLPQLQSVCIQTNLPTRPSTHSGSALNKQLSSVTVATPSSSAHSSIHNNIYAWIVIVLDYFHTTIYITSFKLYAFEQGLLPL